MRGPLTSKRHVALSPCVVRLSFPRVRRAATQLARACVRCQIDGGGQEFLRQRSEACHKRQRMHKPLATLATKKYQSSRQRSGPMGPVVITLLVLLGVGLLPNLVEAVKGYMSHERETLDAVIKARNSAMAAEQKVAANPSDPTAVRKLNQAEAQLGGILGRLFALSEAYPDLKANQNMLALQEELTSTENKIGFARQAFNDAATYYNIRREVFPAVKVAGMFGFKEAALLETAETERAPPKVSFQ